MMHSDAMSVSALQSAAPGAVDLWRFKHPGAKLFTYFSEANGYAARHDRIYGSAALVSHILSCKCVPAAFSDHGMTDLLPVLPPAARGPGLSRARLDFMASDQHAGEFQQWLRDELQGAHTSDQSLLTWWPDFKRRFRVQTIQQNGAWKAALPLTRLCGVGGGGGGCVS